MKAGTTSRQLPVPPFPGSKMPMFFSPNGMDIAVVMAWDDQMDPAQLLNLLDPIIKDGMGYSLFKGKQNVLF